MRVSQGTILQGHTVRLSSQQVGIQVQPQPVEGMRCNDLRRSFPCSKTQQGITRIVNMLIEHREFMRQEDIGSNECQAEQSWQPDALMASYHQQIKEH